MESITTARTIFDLQNELSGEVLTDSASLGLYATDASLYQITPIAVVLPKTEEDVLKTIAYAQSQKISLLPRGGGTSLAGQTVGSSIILDFSKYLNDILAFNEEERWIRVQPGMTRDELNHFLKPYQLHFAPDPATSSRANIGGMIGNNSSGTKSILFGKTVDHLLELKIALIDGTILHLKNLTPKQWNLKANETGVEGRIYQAFRSLIFQNSEAISAAFPKVMRRVQGYNLDEFINTENWNLAKLICGSEGTLCTILEAKINLEPLPKFRSICVVHFDTVMEAIRAVETMLPFQPSAVEILDSYVIELSKNNLTTQRHTSFIEGNPDAIQIVEFYGQDEDEIRSRQMNMIRALQQLDLGYAYPVFPEGEVFNDVWMVRKKGLGLMLGMKSDKKPLAFIEDASIPVKVLPEYIEKVLAVCAKYDTKAAAYAHASVGVIHVRPILDLRLSEDIEKFKRISQETFELVKHYGGSWSGEHGDGLVRSAYLKDYFGAEVYQLLKEVKQLFDPENLMNPGKIIDAPPIDQNLRYGVTYKDDSFETVYHYREDGNFRKAVHMCTGVGECRKTIGGTMCPSYRATRDEEHSTRGRANLLRLGMSGQLNNGDLTHPRILEALSLCLSCKACKSECPSNVDMAKLKSEVLQLHYDKNSISVRDRMTKSSRKAAQRLSGPLAGTVNGVLQSSVGRFALEKIAGLDRRRNLPKYASSTFVDWYKANYSPFDDNDIEVFLFVDTYLNFHEPGIGIGAVKLLNKLGYTVRIADVGCCQRPKISNGFLRDAKKEGSKILASLDTLAKGDTKVVVCEPSCYSALIDDLVDLADDEALGHRIQNKVVSISSFVADHLKKRPESAPIIEGHAQLQLHGHCHEKAISGTDQLHYVLNRLTGGSISEIPSGCCGMAGSFGYEKEHYKISKDIAHEILIPEIQNASTDTTTIANGFSCRHQIADFSSKKSDALGRVILAYLILIGFYNVAYSLQR